MADSGDQYHDAARRFHATLSPSDEVVVSDYVFDETITRIRMVRGHASAVLAGEALRSSTTVRFERLTDSDFETAWEKFVSYSDQRLSFTDCTIIAMAQRLRVRRIFAFDDDFVRIGLETIPGS